MTPTNDHSGNPLSRRNLIASATGAAAAIALGGSGGITMAAENASAGKDIGANADAVRNGKLPQSVCQWCFKKWSIEELAQTAQKIGLKGIDLVGPETFDHVRVGVDQHTTMAGGGASHHLARECDIVGL